MDIKAGYEVGTGNEVFVKESHLIVTGVTQLSGKTTTLEALISRSGKKAIVFSTKPGEGSFLQASECFPFFKERSDWRFVASLLEATMNEKMKFERAWIIHACEGTQSLKEVQKRIEGFLANSKLSDFNRNIYTTLNEYFKIITPQIDRLRFTTELNLADGINVMQLEKMSDELQSLVIRSVLENVLKEKKDVIVVIPEAWKFLPQGKGNPCKNAAEQFIRQGAANRNYLWIDSQDMTGVDKTPLKMVSTWIMGLQTEMNEVKRTIEQMPIPKKDRPPVDKIMTLEVGHFFVCSPHAGSILTYIQPVWMNDDDACWIAEGKLKVGDVKKPVNNIRYPNEEEHIFTGGENMEWPQLLIEAVAKEVTKQLQSERPAPVAVGNLSNDEKKELQDAWNKLSGKITFIETEMQKKAMSGLTPIMAGTDKESIVNEVLSRINVQGNVTQFTVAPLEALKQQFLLEAKERIIATVKGFTENEKKALKFVEATGRGISQKDMCEMCFNRSSVGGSSTEVKNIVLKVVEVELLRRDKNGVTYPNLKAKITKDLQFHDAKPEEAELLYNHIINELL